MRRPKFYLALIGELAATLDDADGIVIDPEALRVRVSKSEAYMLELGTVLSISQAVVPGLQRPLILILSWIFPQTRREIVNRILTNSMCLWLALFVSCGRPGSADRGVPASAPADLVVTFNGPANSCAVSKRGGYERALNAMPRGAFVCGEDAEDAPRLFVRLQDDSGH